jgi:hypothetical protein
MTDTLWADVSYYQQVVNDTYPYAIFAFRSNDGTFVDPNFAANLVWAKEAVSTGKIKGFIVYFVIRFPTDGSLNTLKNLVGTPHPKMAVMIDVESWKGSIVGDHSAEINSARENLINWLNGARPRFRRFFYRGRDRKRVIGYGNVGDLESLWPVSRDANLIVAAYGSNPSYPRRLAHQFSSAYFVPPFGNCDINSADGYTAQNTVKALGLDRRKVKPVAPPDFPLKAKDCFAKVPGGVQFGQADHTYIHPDTVHHSVRQIQAQLVKHGFVTKEQAANFADGNYGPLTENGVRRFQAAQVSTRWRQHGRVTKRVWKKLFALG